MRITGNQGPEGGPSSAPSKYVNTATLTHEGLTISFPFNPNSTQWQYLLNTQYISTYGGYVEQLLSTTTQSMLVEGEAGSRKRLLKLYSELLTIQTQQIDSQTSALLTIPTGLEVSGSISLNVWFNNIDIGIDTTTVTYPYRIIFQVRDGNYSQLNQLLLSVELSKITTALGFAEGVGFTSGGLYQGLNTDAKMTAAQLGEWLYNPPNQTKKISDLTVKGSWNF